jgi:hypothetical protein
MYTRSLTLLKPKPRLEAIVLIETRYILLIFTIFRFFLTFNSPKPSSTLSKGKNKGGRPFGSKNKNLELYMLRALALEQEEKIRALSKEVLALHAQIAANSQPIFNPIKDLESYDFARQSEPLFDFFEQGFTSEIPFKTSKFSLLLF